jgi:hypothetical protein
MTGLWQALRSLWGGGASGSIASIPSDADLNAPTSSMAGEDLTEYERSKLFNNICPDCGWGGLVYGPCGGASQNVACQVCGSDFWVAGYRDTVLAGGRISTKGQPDRQRLFAIYGIHLEGK